MDKSKYPANWPQISIEIRRDRANWCCEWCGAKYDLPHPMTGSRVVLTVAHLGIDKPDGSKGDKSDTMDCRYDNLAALCQRCHLNYDRPENIEKILRTRQQKLAEQRRLYGQIPLLQEVS
jgi:hypothetical protein